VGTDLPHGGGATWLTGTYDEASDVLYWTTGNPCPDYDGNNRLGDNLYTDSVLAIKLRTGQLLWSYQFTPHDQFDFDAEQTPMPVDALYQGRQRQLLLQASRNGIFYVLDRVTGPFLRATPFVKDVTWASGIDAKGRPILTPGETPSPSGTTVCPAPVAPRTGCPMRSIRPQDCITSWRTKVAPPTWTIRTPLRRASWNMADTPLRSRDTNTSGPSICKPGRSHGTSP